MLKSTFDYIKQYVSISNQKHDMHMVVKQLALTSSWHTGSLKDDMKKLGRRTLQPFIKISKRPQRNIDIWKDLGFRSSSSITSFLKHLNWMYTPMKQSANNKDINQR